MQRGLEEEKEEKEENSNWIWRRGANDSAIRYREDKFRFSRLYVALLFPDTRAGWGGEGISPVQKFDRNTKSTRTDFSILLPPPAFLSFLSFPSASESVVIRRINPRREGGDELRFGANIATPFFPLWQGAKETRKGRSREWNRRGCADVFGLRTPKETGIDERLRRRPSENHFALAARIRREAKRRRVSETVREPPL